MASLIWENQYIKKEKLKCKIIRNMVIDLSQMWRGSRDDGGGKREEEGGKN